MSKRTLVILILLFVPVFLLGFTVVHEVGHTVLARLLGDPAATFHLYKITRTSLCLGCSIYDETKLTPFGNLLVSIGGLLFTQGTAILILFLARRAALGTFCRRLLIGCGLAFAFLDVPVQVVQGLSAKVAQQSGLTGVDLADFLYLSSRQTGISPTYLKVGLLLVALVYLVVVYRWRPRHGQAAPSAR